MALTKRDNYYYGDGPADIRLELLRYSNKTGYLAHQFAEATCKCGGTLFGLALDDTQGAAVRTCLGCATKHPIGDSGDYLGEAELEECACPCGGEAFEIMVGVSLYDESADVRWLYLGCRCPKCGLTAAYGDWKNEFIGYQELLARV